MKFIRSVLITWVLCSLGSNAFADFKVFRGTAEWNGSKSFNSIEQSGIEMDSVERALCECRMAGMQYCVVKETTLNRNIKVGERRSLSTTTLVHGYESAPVGEIIPFSGKGTFFTLADNATGPLQIFSTKRIALKQALANCYDRFEFCAVLGIKITETNNLRKEEGSSETRYTTAEAKVVGIKAFLEPAIAMATVVSETIAAASNE